MEKKSGKVDSGACVETQRLLQAGSLRKKSWGNGTKCRGFPDACCKRLEPK